MDVRDAVASRYSCRAFLPDPVPEAIIRDIVAGAARAPSGGNVQPWFVHALAGARLEALRAAIRARFDELPAAEGSEYPIYPTPLKQPYYARRHEVGALLYAALGIARENREARYRQYARNFEVFDAPVALFIAIDRSLGPPQWADLGAYVQTVMLLARSHGLHSCGQEAWTHWYKTLAVHLALPPDRMVFCGIALGYEDPAAAVNRWRAPRASLHDFATFDGFTA